MKNFLYVSTTWLVSNILHPFVFIGSCHLIYGSTPSDLFFPVLIFGFLFSIPAYILCLIAFKMVRLAECSIVLKLWSWLVSLALCISGGAVFINLVFGGFTQNIDDLLLLTAPAILSAWLATLFRYKQFVSLFNTQHENRYYHQH
jgi:hypothetical protein